MPLLALSSALPLALLPRKEPNLITQPELPFERLSP